MDHVREERFPDFLRYQLLCEMPKVRTQRLFKIVRARVVTSSDVFALLDALGPRAELFAAFGDASHEFWLDLASAKLPLRELSVFRAKQMTPLLFAAHEKLSKDKSAGVLRLVSVLTYRPTIIGRRNPNEWETAYHSAAKSVLAGIVKTPQQIFGLLRDVYPSDAELEADFSRIEMRTGGASKRLAKYTLCRLESDAGSRDCDFENDPSTIEHVLPENPESTWDDVFPLARQSEFVYRLGNLTLLEASTNRSAGAGSYSDKLPGYQSRGYALSREVAAVAAEAWTPRAVDLRQQRLAKRAVHVWRVDY